MVNVKKNKLKKSTRNLTKKVSKKTSNKNSNKTTKNSKSFVKNKKVVKSKNTKVKTKSVKNNIKNNKKNIKNIKDVKNKKTVRKMKEEKSKKSKSKVKEAMPIYSNNEIREDYILGHKVLIAENRNLRPENFKKTKNSKVGKDYFAPGNESETPKEIGRIGTEKKWLIRWFENKFPLFNPNVEEKKERYNPLYQSMPAKGFHEIIVGTPNKNKELEDFTPKQVEELLKVYASEIERLHSDKKIKYVLVFKNKGVNAGASINHEHTQIIALPFVPPRADEKMSSSNRYFRTRKKCIYCELMNEEKKTERFIFENKSFIVLAPYASRFNFEAHILPKAHKTSFKEFLPKDYEDLAEALLFVLKRLKKLNLDYNIVLYYEPQFKAYKEKNSGLHFHIEILPRRQVWAGFELGSGIIVNEVSPETAAKFYRTGKF